MLNEDKNGGALGVARLGTGCSTDNSLEEISRTTVPPTCCPPTWAQASARSVPIRYAALVILCALPAMRESFRLSAVSDLDIWWHLRTGVSILQNRAIPRTGWFSQNAAAQWTDSSWAHDAVLGFAYRLIGIRAIPVMQMTAIAAMAAALFTLARGFRGNWWRGIALSTIGLYLLGPVPQPAMMSIVLFAIELHLLFEYRRDGDLLNLMTLPGLLAVWANLHIGFVFGVALLFVFAIVLSLEKVMRRFTVGSNTDHSSGPEIIKPLGIILLSMLATLLNPYTFHLFSAAGTELYSTALVDRVVELHSIAFRRPSDFILLLLTMGTLMVLGYRRSIDLFKLTTLVAAMALGFRFERETWILVLLCIAAISDTPFADGRSFARPSWLRFGSRAYGAFAVAIVATVVTAAALWIPADETRILDRADARLPSAACDFIRKHNLPQPLFNSYAWGDFLIWRLPEYPVAIDNRVSLYGDEALLKHFETIEGKQPLENYPRFANARTILLEQNSDLAKALTTIPALSRQFHQVYSDKVAIVLLRN